VSDAARGPRPALACLQRAVACQRVCMRVVKMILDVGASPGLRVHCPALPFCSRRSRWTSGRARLDLARRAWALAALEDACFDFDIDAYAARVTTNEQFGADASDRSARSDLCFEARDADGADARVGVIGDQTSELACSFFGYGAAVRAERQQDAGRAVVGRPIWLAARRALAHHVGRFEQLAQSVVGRLPKLERPARADGERFGFYGTGTASFTRQAAPAETRTGSYVVRADNAKFVVIRRSNRRLLGILSDLASKRNLACCWRTSKMPLKIGHSDGVFR
jgi:hypothetical protein